MKIWGEMIESQNPLGIPLGGNKSNGRHLIRFKYIPPDID